MRTSSLVSVLVALAGCGGAISKQDTADPSTVDAAPLAPMPAAPELDAADPNAVDAGPLAPIPAERTPDAGAGSPRDPCAPPPDGSWLDACGISNAPTGWITAVACVDAPPDDCTAVGDILCCSSSPEVSQ